MAKRIFEADIEAPSFIKKGGLPSQYLKADGSVDDGLAFIKSNQSLSLASRKDDVLYGIIDRYTGEEITLSKVTGSPTVDGVMYFALGAERFKRNCRTVTPQMYGAKADGATNDTTAIQNAINFCIANNEILEITGSFACSTITINNNLQLETDCSLQILTDVDGIVITGRNTGYTDANITTVKHTGILNIRGFLANSLSKGITLKNGCLYSSFDKVFVRNFGLGVDYEKSGNNNIINWNLLDVRDCSGAGSTTFTKGAFVSPNNVFNIGEITTPIPILTNMGTVLILQATEGSDYRTYPIVAKPATANTYYIGNFDQLPASGTLVYYTGGGVLHEKHSDNGAIQYKSLRLGGIAGASLTVQSFYGVTVNGGQIEGCYTNVIIGGIFMNGANPETIYSIRSTITGMHTEANDAQNPLVYSLKKSMIVFEGNIMPQPFVGAPETGVKFYDPSGSDRNSNVYYGKPNATFPIIEPIDPTFKIYNDVSSFSSLLTLDLRDLLSGMTYVGDSRIKHTAVGEYNLLNVPAGETRTLRVRPFGWNTLNGGTAQEDITINGVAGVQEYKITFLLVDKDFTYYINEVSTNTGGTLGANLFPYKVKTTITSGDPTTGHLVYNDTTQINSTSIFCSHLVENDYDVRLFLEGFTSGDTLIIQDRDNSSNSQVWQINGKTPDPTFVSYEVSLISSSGTGTTNFANNHEVFMVRQATSVSSEGYIQRPVKFITTATYDFITADKDKSLVVTSEDVITSINLNQNVFAVNDEIELYDKANSHKTRIYPGVGITIFHAGQTYVNGQYFDFGTYQKIWLKCIDVNKFDVVYVYEGVTDVGDGGLSKKVIVSDAVNTAISGVAVKTLAKTYEIPAGTLTPNGFLEYYVFVRRQGGSSLAYSFEIAVNSTNNAATAVTIGVGSSGNFDPFSAIKGWHLLKNNLILNPFFTGATNLGAEYRFSTAPLDNTANPVWFFVFVSPGADNQTINIEGVEILN